MNLQEPFDGRVLGNEQSIDEKVPVAGVNGDGTVWNRDGQSALKHVAKRSELVREGVVRQHTRQARHRASGGPWAPNRERVPADARDRPPLCVLAIFASLAVQSNLPTVSEGSGSTENCAVFRLAS